MCAWRQDHRQSSDGFCEGLAAGQQHNEYTLWSQQCLSEKATNRSGKSHQQSDDVSIEAGSKASLEKEDKRRRDSHNANYAMSKNEYSGGLPMMDLTSFPRG